MNEYFSTYLDDSFKLLYVNQTIQPMKIGLSEARISHLCRLVFFLKSNLLKGNSLKLTKSEVFAIAYDFIVCIN